MGETADPWGKKDRGLMGTGSHVIWKGKPLTNRKKGIAGSGKSRDVGKPLTSGKNRSWAQGEGKPRRKRGRKVQSPILGRGGGP